jgi:hypothetical protein
MDITVVQARGLGAMPFQETGLVYRLKAGSTQIVIAQPVKRQKSVRAFRVLRG